MKKLMIAAAVAAMASASFADACSEPCPFGYRLKVLVRTTVPQSITYGVGLCGDVSNTCWRTLSTRRFIGMVIGNGPDASGICGETGCGCNTWAGAYAAMWDYDTKKAFNLNADSEMIQLDRINYQTGRDQTEMVFKLFPELSYTIGSAKGEMTFAGFGQVVQNKYGYPTVQWIAGYCAGQLPLACGNGDQCRELFSPTLVWSLCATQNALLPDIDAYLEPLTAAYGKWTLTWDNDYAARVGAKQLVPGGVIAPTGWDRVQTVKIGR